MKTAAATGRLQIMIRPSPWWMGGLVLTGKTVSAQFGFDAFLRRPLVKKPYLSICPLPKQMHPVDGAFRVTADTRIVVSDSADAALQRCATLLQRELRRWHGLNVPVRQTSGRGTTITLERQDVDLPTSSYKVVGRRLAKLALGDAYGKSQYQPGPHLDKISYFRSLHGDGIKLSFHGVNGRLKAAVRVSGFTLRREDQTNDGLTIIRQELDPDDPNGVLLHLVFKLAEKQPLYLWYGWGANPFCHVTDEENMALPMFGPVALPSRK